MHAASIAIRWFVWRSYRQRSPPPPFLHLSWLLLPFTFSSRLLAYLNLKMKSIWDGLGFFYLFKNGKESRGTLFACPISLVHIGTRTNLAGSLTGISTKFCIMHQLPARSLASTPPVRSYFFYSRNYSWSISIFWTFPILALKKFLPSQILSSSRPTKLAIGQIFYLHPSVLRPSVF